MKGELRLERTNVAMPESTFEDLCGSTGHAWLSKIRGQADKKVDIHLLTYK